MKKWKKNLIAVALLVAVCGGIYLNWRLSKDQTAVSLTDTLDKDKIMSSDTLTMNDNIMNMDNTMSEYFAAVRLSRQEARDSAVAMLQEAMAYSEDPDSAPSNAQLEELVNMALYEAQIESLVIAKGYTDCVAYISDDGISVAVASPEGGLQQDDVAVIADIVLSQSDFTIADIHVLEVQ